MILTQVGRENGKEMEEQASPELGVVSASELSRYSPENATESEKTKRKSKKTNGEGLGFRLGVKK